MSWRVTTFDVWVQSRFAETRFAEDTDVWVTQYTTTRVNHCVNGEMKCKILTSQMRVTNFVEKKFE